MGQNASSFFIATLGKWKGLAEDVVAPGQGPKSP